MSENSRMEWKNRFVVGAANSGENYTKPVYIPHYGRLLFPPTSNYEEPDSNRSGLQIRIPKAKNAGEIIGEHDEHMKSIVRKAMDEIAATVPAEKRDMAYRSFEKHILEALALVASQRQPIAEPREDNESTVVSSISSRSGGRSNSDRSSNGSSSTPRLENAWSPTPKGAVPKNRMKKRTQRRTR